MKRATLFLVIALLFLLISCRSETVSYPTLSPTPNTKPTQGFMPTPTATIPDVPSRAVQFMTSDHIQLAGLLYGHGRTAVICSHELHTTKAIWSNSGVAQRLAALGYIVLAYDFRGYGDSSGQRNAGANDVDLHAAIAFVRHQGATKIVLLGSSMGGTVTLKVAASEQVAAVITLSAPQEFGVNVSDADIQAITAPKLFVNSQNDDFASDTMHMYSVANPPKELHLYPGTAHGIAIFDGEDLLQRLLDFIARSAPASSS